MRLHDICGRLPQKTTKECLAGEDPEEMESVPTIVAELDAAHERGGTLLAAAASMMICWLRSPSVCGSESNLR